MHEQIVEAIKRSSEKMAFHKIAIGEIFHDGFYKGQYMVIEKISKSQAQVVEVHPPDYRPRMVGGVYHFSPHQPVWKLEE